VLCVLTLELAPLRETSRLRIISLEFRRFLSKFSSVFILQAFAFLRVLPVLSVSSVVEVLTLFSPCISVSPRFRGGLWVLLVAPLRVSVVIPVFYCDSLRSETV
jgi:hypothetical protein